MKSFELTAIQILEKYHFSREDAEAFLEVIKEAKSEDVSTKGDIFRLEKQISDNTLSIKTMERDIRSLEVKIESVKNQLILWVFSIMFAMAGLIVGVLKFL